MTMILRHTPQKPASEEHDSEIRLLMSRLTLEEKISMIHGGGVFRTAPVERLGIPALKMSDGPMGVRQEFPDDSLRPVGNSDDYVTYNPSNGAVAATWNPKRAYECGQVLGEEARGRGKDVILAPGINIKRDPLCGRNFEYMSEDPCLIAAMAVPFIQGVQERDVAACVKHFAANGQETDRFQVDTLVDERSLQEIYYPGFRAAVQKGGSLSLMNAYNRLNGTHCSENQELLDHVLRETWGYDGTVISDWGSVHTTKEAANAAIDIEMDISADFDHYHFADSLLQAVKDGVVAEEKIDKKVENILRMMFRLKMLGAGAVGRNSGSYNALRHQHVTRQAAREAIVLLKNEGGLLPIGKERLEMTWDSLEGSRTENVPQSGQAVTSQIPAAPRRRKVAVIGRNAEQLHAAGGGSAEIKAFYEISPLMGLKTALGGNVEVVYAPGYYIPGEKGVNEMDWSSPCLERRAMNGETGRKEEVENLQETRRVILEQREKLKAEACTLAKNADEVIFVGGLNHDYDQEGRDRFNMKLPYGQDELIEALLEIKPDMIVIIVAGSPVEMPWLSRTKALIWCYYSGMEAGNALADILLGKVNPSAKLPETFPVVYADTVTAKNGQFGRQGSVEYREGIFVGYRYYEKEKVKPAFPFGFGMSYTDFVMGDVRVQNNYISAVPATGAEYALGDRTADIYDIAVTISVEVENTGAMDGAEVVQCYVEDCECSVERPFKELGAFQKVFLRQGEKKQIQLELPYRAFAFYDVERGAFVVESGRFVLHIGNSSENCPLCVEMEIACGM